MSAPFDVRLMNILATLLFIGFFAMAVLAGGWWVLRQPFFPLGGIKVDGDVMHNNVVTLRANVASQLSGNFFTVDLARARAAFEAVPWVRQAVVRREFPDQLRATLSEHAPAAHWGGPDDSRMLDKFGEIFDATGADPGDGRPRLSGPDDQAHHVLGMFQELKPLFQAHDMDLEALSLSRRGSWQATFSSGAVIELGRGSSDEVKARADRFLISVKKVASQYGRSVDSVESADLRHADAYALRLRGVTVSTESAPSTGAAAPAAAAPKPRSAARRTPQGH